MSASTLLLYLLCCDTSILLLYKLKLYKKKYLCYKLKKQIHRSQPRCSKSLYFYIYNDYRKMYYTIMNTNLLLYETHVPIKGYTKLWPTDIKCPVCQINVITRDKSHKPLYVPNKKYEGGEKVVIYVCTTCYQTFKNTGAMTVEELKEEYKCHMELKMHLRSVLRTGE